jgi:acyl-CoA 6-desaturase (Delta-6 desaturase)
LQEVIYGVGCGMSGGWWRSQHNRHHSMPQKIGHDVDLNTLPLVAFTNKVFKRFGFIQKIWIALQAILFPVLTTTLVALGWQFYLHPRYILRKKNWNELLMLCIRYAGWTYLFTLRFGLYQSMLIYLAYNWMAANYIFINFAVSHTHLDTVPVDDKSVSYINLIYILFLQMKLFSFD